MHIAFFLSSIGDTDLAVKTIAALNTKQGHRLSLVFLTEASEQRAKDSRFDLLLSKFSLHYEGRFLPKAKLAGTEKEAVQVFLNGLAPDFAYLGVPSNDNQLPFCIADMLAIPILMAYEFMFKPERHVLWQYLPSLSKKANIKWALPLEKAKEDFQDLAAEALLIIGHLSIDRACDPNPGPKKDSAEIRKALELAESADFTFLSSSTQAVALDEAFLDAIFKAIAKHPSRQLRLGLHPGIENVSDYLEKMLNLYQAYPEMAAQFKIILSDRLVGLGKIPQVLLENPAYTEVFLRVNISGDEAAFAADRVAQAVPGALLNQAVLEGKPVYSHTGKAYLAPQGQPATDYFSETPMVFFKALRQAPRGKESLGLSKDKTAAELCAQAIVGP